MPWSAVAGMSTYHRPCVGAARARMSRTGPWVVIVREAHHRPELELELVPLEMGLAAETTLARATEVWGASLAPSAEALGAPAHLCWNSYRVDADHWSHSLPDC